MMLPAVKCVIRYIKKSKRKRDVLIRDISEIKNNKSK